jgi:transposase-like protein
MLRAFFEVCKQQRRQGKTAFCDPALEPVKINSAKVICPKCKARSSMVPHSMYSRNYVHIEEGRVVSAIIEISRLRCTSCDTTHALLPLTVIPYSVFSIRFIASVIVDWETMRFSSIEALCDYYKIAINTFYRIRERFYSSVRITLGATHRRQDGIALAVVLTGEDYCQSDTILSAFFHATSTSFSQGLGP